MIPTDLNGRYLLRDRGDLRMQHAHNCILFSFLCTPFYFKKEPGSDWEGKKTRHSFRKTLFLFPVEEFAAVKGRIFAFLRGSTRKGRAFSIILGFRKKPHATDRVSGILRAESSMILLIVFSIQMKWPFCMPLIVRVVSIC